jgi:hypothetical protein
MNGRNMKSLKKICLILTLLSSLSACHNVPAWQYGMFKRPAGNHSYSPVYIKGWQDGCESGAQASATYLYRLRYNFKQDWQLLNNNYYVNGWEAAYNHCRKYILQHNLSHS